MEGFPRISRLEGHRRGALHPRELVHFRDGKRASETSAHLADDTRGGMASEMARLPPCEARGDAVEKTGGVHISRPGRVDGFRGDTFDGNDGILDHQNGSEFPHGQGDIRGVPVDDPGAFDGVLGVAEAASFIDIAKEKIHGAFDQFPEIVLKMGDEKWIGNRERDFDAVPLREFDRLEGRRFRIFRRE